MAREITLSMTAGQIATAHPELIPELERLGIDYCCRGNQTLDQAATDAGLRPEEAVRTLIACEPDPAAGPAETIDFAAMSMTELADHLEQTHHVYARETLDRLDTLISKCVAAHGDEEPRLAQLQSTVAALTEDMHDHFIREERVLFPWLRRLERKTEIQGGPPWSVRRPIDCMVHDHDDVGEAFRRIHELTDGLTAPEGACSTWTQCYRLLGDLERDTHRHIHKENNILFPAGIAAEERLGGGPAKKHRRVPTQPGGFTLIELLVVIAIIALLIGIILPALGKARSAGRSVVCLANSHSIATAMTMYADDDRAEHFPTARMPGMAMDGNPPAPFTISWVYLLAPYVGVEATLPDNPTAEEIRAFIERMPVCQCPEDHSQNWDAVMMPRLASYGINAYLTPNHPPYWGVKASQIEFPSRCVLSAELTEEMAMDHFMPMFWGDPPTVANPMIQARQWDASTQLPKVIQHTRHGGERANYVFTDGHAGPHPFSDTWVQVVGETPSRNWYDPKAP
ncbi:MAG: DUF542 domain-containing protein [Phycisphaerales bacterium]|nr:DUF542 domain-containing protein [Phycisphaerales bacterium]